MSESVAKVCLLLALIGCGLCIQPKPKAAKFGETQETEKSALTETEVMPNTTCNREVVLTLYYPSQIISSPNYPFSYPNNMNCTIKVSAIGDFSIEVLFTDFLMEDGGEK